MFDMGKKIIKYPRLTQDYPEKSLNSEFFIGKPDIDIRKCKMCKECVSRCPSDAIKVDNKTNKIGFNYDECIFCMLCEEICPSKAIKMSDKIETAQKSRDKLRIDAIVINDSDIRDKPYEYISKQLEDKIKKQFKRSLNIREVDAGSCNGCDYEINAMNNPFNDIERLGIHFVASPRHADMLLVTGVVTRNMKEALIKTYNATPDPKLVVAVGACGCSGGIFRNSYAGGDGVDSVLPVDVYVIGCPPRPQAIIYGILSALDKI